MADPTANIKCFAVYAKDLNVKKNSSSGGVFFLLSKWVISQGGIVFGARFNENWMVEHSYCDNLEDLKAFLGSKYVQSKMKNIYQDVKRELENKRLVLFSGTPCQIGGLKSFLGKSYDNLFLIDFVCHGVPSPMIWHQYLEEQYDVSSIRNISFRNKDKGWRNFSLKIDTDKASYSNTLKEDWYLRGFLKNVYLRPSCYECKFKGIDRISDFTMADFWGIWEVMPSFNDDKGVSLITINSEKGGRLWNEICDETEYQRLNINDAVKYNSAMTESVCRQKSRDVFYKTKGSVQKRVRKLTKEYKFKKVLRKIKRLLRHI